MKPSGKKKMRKYHFRLETLKRFYQTERDQQQIRLAEACRAKEILQQQQAELNKHGELLTRAIDASRDIRQLEAALNDNLRSLSGAQHFEATVNSLAAAIHLLNTRLGSIPEANPPLELDPTDSQDRAA